MQRDCSIDLLRFSGILIIIFAHTYPPEWLFQIRNFGTPLLIVGSALTYSLIYENKNLNIWSFYKKRFSKIIIPPWVFLSAFFASAYLRNLIFDIDFPFSINTIISSYVFWEGIGFVWIFRVYLILALITPLVLFLNKRIKSNITYFLILAILWIFYHYLLYEINLYLNFDMRYYVNRGLMVVIPYSIVFMYGFRLKKLSIKSVYYITLFFLFLFILNGYYLYFENGHFIPTQKFKLPPKAYYLSYAMLCVNLIYIFFVRKIKISYNPIIFWLSSNSMWIYLWHIFAFYVLKYSGIVFEKTVLNSIEKFLIFFLSAVILTYTQSIFLKKIFYDTKGSRIGVILNYLR